MRQRVDEDSRIPQSKHLEEAVDRAVGAAVADPNRVTQDQHDGSQKCQQRRRKRLGLFFRDKMS
jgi:hypothetical protein